MFAGRFKKNAVRLRSVYSLRESKMRYSVIIRPRIFSNNNENVESSGRAARAHFHHKTVPASGGRLVLSLSLSLFLGTMHDSYFTCRTCATKAFIRLVRIFAHSLGLSSDRPYGKRPPARGKHGGRRRAGVSFPPRRFPRLERRTCQRDCTRTPSAL